MNSIEHVRNRLSKAIVNLENNPVILRKLAEVVKKKLLFCFSISLANQMKS